MTSTTRRWSLVGAGLAIVVAVGLVLALGVFSDGSGDDPVATTVSDDAGSAADPATPSPDTDPSPDQTGSVPSEEASPDVTGTPENSSPLGGSVLLPTPMSGQEALDALGEDIALVAERNGMTVERVESILTGQPSARVGRTGQIFFADTLTRVPIPPTQNPTPSPTDG